MKKITLKKALEALGYTKVKINRNYNYRSGFMEKDGQTFYFSTRDLRGCDFSDNHFLLIRTAKDQNDYTGGENTYDAVQKLKEMGYVLNVPFLSCDYNRR